MPTYSYRREDGTIFDVFQRITDDALTTDPETGQPVVRVISGGAGLQFKGTGFYLTDYVRKDSKSESSDRTSQKTGTAAPKPEAKPEAKPAPKAAPAAASTPAAKKD
ncbi:MAG TPA: zinc ribbon domain-containing protein [Rubricoccaceae bacterium]|jgi:putative FmdB family regulatory protein